jgi:putative transposase
MQKSRYTDSQLPAILKQNKAEVSVPNLCREHGMSDAAFYKCRPIKSGIY